jgi:hypothetical protein
LKIFYQENDQGGHLVPTVSSIPISSLFGLIKISSGGKGHSRSVHESHRLLQKHA